MDALYQEKILAFARSSRESEVVPDADATATVSNPVCGDRVEVRLKLDENNIVTAASTDVRGCALCEAGAGLFVNMAPGLESASSQDCTPIFQAGSLAMTKMTSARQCKIFILSATSGTGINACCWRLKLPRVRSTTNPDQT